MPVRDRKFYIMKHNNDAEIRSRQRERASGQRQRKITGETLNKYALDDMAAKKNASRNNMAPPEF